MGGLSLGDSSDPKAKSFTVWVVFIKPVLILKPGISASQFFTIKSLPSRGWDGQELHAKGKEGKLYTKNTLKKLLCTFYIKIS